MIYVVCDEQNKVCSTFTDTYALTQTEDNFVLKQDEDVTFLFPLSFNLYQVEDCPDDVNSATYTYIPKNGFVKVPEPEPEPDPAEADKEAIRQEYREELAKEIAQN